jgi:pyruvyltransferase
MHSNGRLPYAPNKIHAVRGPLTRDLLLKQGFDCPEIYGDPALLYPRFYKPNIKKKYRFGIIPHYADFSDPWVQKFSNNPDVKIINIKDRTCNKFIDDIHECEILLSSSLHGIIAGDAYGIPSYWIELSNKVHGKGFKFNDYFLSVKRPLVEPIRPKLETNIKDFSNTFYNYKIDIDLDLLYNACPFKQS